MRCSRARRLISRGLDEDLSVMDALELEAHLNECPECSAVQHDLRRITGVMPSVCTTHPADSLVDDVLNRIDSGGGRAVLRAKRTRLGYAIGAALAAAMAGAWFVTSTIRAQRFESDRRVQVERAVQVTAAQSMALAASDPLEDVSIVTLALHGTNGVGDGDE